ncbi:MAG: ribosome biogenesis factor YjgA [Stenotrophobium sp.]
MKKRQDTHAKASDAEDFYAGPSKTQIKNAMLELQVLGVTLLELPDEQLDLLITDEGPLREAVRDLRRITAHGARSRQASYVGKLLRDVDTEPLRKALAVWHAHKVRDVQALREIEQWREKMIGSDAGWAEWTARYPAGDTRQLHALVRDARHERATAKITGASGNGRAFREMFKLLRSALLAKREAGRP